MTDHEQLSGRPEFDTIAGWVAPEATVLDLGCGDGLLLKFLTGTRGVKGYGIEISLSDTAKE